MNKITAPFRDLGWLMFIMLAIGIAGFTGLVRTQIAEAAQSASDYCNQFVSSADSTDVANRKKTACRDGLKGTDCQNYLDAGFSQDIADICSKAAQDLASGVVSPGQVSVPSTPSTGSDSDSSGSQSGAQNANQQNLLEQAKNLSQFVDLLHQTGPDADVKNLDSQDSTDPSYYINGAGKKQPITVLNAGNGSSPAILFFNGGAWHANDQTGERVMAAEDNGENPAGRGYAMLDVTYRLGSSGVYYMFEDVMRGIQHVTKNAAAYGIDPNKIVIWGDSAGGSLTMRAAASGKSGAKAAVGWSAPTNAYTALFRSLASFAIGMDHSTCIPTDLAGLANFANLYNGGSGNVAEYGQGLSSNDFSAIGINSPTGGADPLALFTQGLVAGRNALSALNDVESISNQIKGKNYTGLAASTFNLATTKFNECIENFNALSPAIFTSPDTPPTVTAEFENDMTVGPDQATGMRDKLRSMGIKSQALILPGTPECVQKAPDTFGTGCHLGYYSKFVCDTLNFIDSVVQPERGRADCANGIAGDAEAGSGPTSSQAPVSGTGGGGSGGGSSGGSGGGGGNNGGGSSNNSNGNNQSSSPCDANGYVIPGKTGPCPNGTRPDVACTQRGGTYITSNGPHGGGYCKVACDTWNSSCNGGTSPTTGTTSPPVTAPQKCPVGYVWNSAYARCIRVVQGS